MPLEDEWNERRRIQMTSIGGGFKGKHKSACVISVCVIRASMCVIPFSGGLIT